jgi:hypothetical protein
VLAQIDGQTDLETLCDVTGLPMDTVSEIVEGLVAAGVVAPETPKPSATVDADFDPATAFDADAALREEKDATSDSPTHRTLWVTRFLDRNADERLAAVPRAGPDELLALCYDPDPRVVRAVLQHPSAGLVHARLVAAHHGTSVGLEAVMARASFVADAQVARRLLRNPHVAEAHLRRIVDARPLRVVWGFCTDREVGDRSRMHLRGLLLQKFVRATPEERVELIWGTEGRCLALLPGATFDARTTQALSARTYTSALLVQNLAKFRATPPTLLSHLLKQPVVRNNPGLRKLVGAHPNAPRERR